MKKAIYIGSLLPFTGKSIISLAIASIIKEKNMNVSYFKPYGSFPVLYGDVYADQDAVIAKDTLGLECDIKDLSPIVLTQDLKIRGLKGELPSQMKKIEQSFNSICNKTDFVIVGGANYLANGAFLGISGYDIINKLNLSTILVENMDPDLLVDPALVTALKLKGKLDGIILNKVKPEAMDFAKEIIVPFLNKNGIEVIGIIPESKMLAAVSMSEIKDVLSARVVASEEFVEKNYPEKIMIGAMDVESALRHFRKVHNKVVITGGHRSDIILAALETATEGTVVTGGVVPGEIILAKAEERNVPVLMTNDDTFSVVDKIEAILGKARISDAGRIQKGIELVKEYVNFDKILE